MSILNLAVLRWSLLANVYGSSTASPVALTGGEFAASADALAGNDQVTGTGNSDEQGVGAVLANGRFYMSLGNDSFSGIGVAGAKGAEGGNGCDGSDGIALFNNSLLSTGVDRLSFFQRDDDVITGKGGAGGDGNDGSNGSSGAAGGNGGYGGDGGDGIVVDCGSTITTGDGADRITGFGGTGGAGGNGGDGGTGASGGAGGTGGAGGDGIYVSKSSSILMGGGADYITGVGGAAGADGLAGTDGATGAAPLNGAQGTRQGAGIYNQGVIDTGAGADILDAMEGGFAGCGGTYNLGAGNDRVRGFGEGTFNGNGGFDTLLLPGVLEDYSVKVVGTLNGNPVDYEITRGCTTMYANSFEALTFNGHMG